LALGGLGLFFLTTSSGNGCVTFLVYEKETWAFLFSEDARLMVAQLSLFMKNKLGP
jgi:hypothetical protein